jgi:prepilin-type N-terminal cleavage/methylation domain-containing protein
MSIDKTTKASRGAFTLVEVMIVVLIIGILMSIAVPNFIRARETSRASVCIQNLKQIFSAKEQWAMDNKADNGATVAMTVLFGTGTYMKNSPACPSGGTYTVQPVGTNPSCDKSLHVMQ